MGFVDNSVVSGDEGARGRSSRGEQQTAASREQGIEKLYLQSLLLTHGTFIVLLTDACSFVFFFMTVW